MKRSYAVALLIVILAVAGVGAYFITKDDGENSQNQDASQTTQSKSSEEIQQPASNNNAESAESKTFTTEEVAKHSNESDCWTIIDEKVYDLTGYIQNHQGGDEILRACGKNGSTMFNERQAEDGEDIGTGTPHSETAMKDLETLFIGTVSD